MDISAPFKWVYSRVTEGSTWASLAAICSAAATVSTNPATKATLVAVSGAAATIGAALPDKGKQVAAPTDATKSDASKPQ